MSVGNASPETSPASAASIGRARRLAVILATVAFAEVIGTAIVASVGDPRFTLGADLPTVGFLGIVILYPLVGALILQRRPSTRVAWLMIGLGVGLGLGLLLASYGTISQPPAAARPFGFEALVISQLFFVPSLATATTFLMLLFPTDRFIGPRWRLVAALAIFAVALYEVGAILRPGELNSDQLPGVLNPLAAPPPWDQLILAFGNGGSGLAALALVLAAGSLVMRYRRAGRVEAAQIRWLAFVAVLAAVVIVVGSLPLGRVFNDLTFGLGLVLLACMPIAIGIAITRYRLYDIDRLINRAIVYGALTAILAGVFAAAVGLAQRLFVAVTGETSDAAIVATTLVVATLYAPLRKRLDGVVDRRFKYDRSRFGSYRDELEKTLSLVDAGAAAERLAREIARETEVPDVAILDAAGAPSAVVGRWPITEAITIPIPGGHGALHAVLLGSPVKQARLIGQRRPEVEEIASLAARAVRRSEAR